MVDPNKITWYKLRFLITRFEFEYNIRELEEFWSLFRVVIATKFCCIFATTIVFFLAIQIYRAAESGGMGGTCPGPPIWEQT